MVKKKTSRSRSGGDDHAARELELYIDNDQPSYRRKQYMFVNLTKHVCRGGFSKDSASKLMKYLADDAAKRYTKEFATPGDKIFSVATRKKVAGELVKEYLSSLKDCRGRGMCGDLPDDAVTILKKPSCTPGGELSGSRTGRRFKRRSR